jgi:hypothetical protein
VRHLNPNPNKFLDYADSPPLAIHEVQIQQKCKIMGKTIENSGILNENNSRSVR